MVFDDSLQRIGMAVFVGVLTLLPAALHGFRGGFRGLGVFLVLPAELFLVIVAARCM